MSNRGLNLPAVTSLLSDADDPTKEADAALVDSFFLPGGLFSDEGNGRSHNNEDTTTTNNNNNNNNNNMRIDSNLGSSSNVHLPSNPWEQTGSTPNNAFVTELTRTIRAEADSAMVEPLSMQQLRQGMGHTGHRASYDKSTANNNIHPFDFGNRYRHEQSEIFLERPGIDNSHFQQMPELIFDTNQNQISNRTRNESISVIRPPPGFQDGPRSSSNSGFIENTTDTAKNTNSEGNTLDFVASSGDSTVHSNGFPMSNNDRADTSRNVSVDVLGAPNSTLYGNFKPRTSLQQKAPLRSNPTKRGNEGLSELGIRPHSVQADSKYEKEETKGYLAHYFNDPLSLSNDKDDNTNQEMDANEVVSLLVSDESKAPSRKSKECTQDEDCGDQKEAEADVQGEDDEEENSIPSSICVGISGESHSSSLSTCSEVDNSELSSHGSSHVHSANGDDDMDEGVGYDTDQAHVSEIAVGAIGNSLCSSVQIPVDEQCESPAPNVYSKGRTPSITPTGQKFIRGECDQKTSKFASKLLATFLRIVIENCNVFVDLSISAIRKFLFRVKRTKSYERFSQQRRKLSRDLHNFTNWLMDVREVFAVLLMRLINAGRKHSRGMIEAVMILSSFLTQLMKFSIIEALEEFSGVASCYVVFCLVPNAWVTLMEFINLPHWTPHTVAWLAIFALCQQVEEAKLYETSNIPLSSLLKRLLMNLSIVPENSPNEDPFSQHLSSKQKKHQNLPPRQQHDELSRAQDKRVCFLLLKTIKTILPVLYMVEGFSSEFGTMLSLTKVANRLTTAFVVAILRKSILSSPIAWVSWALQILLASIFRSSVLIDVLILMIGLSSIRLIRFLDQQRTLGKELREKSNK